MRLEVTDERARNPRLLVGEWLCGEGEREYRDGVERELPGRDRGTLRLLERSFVSACICGRQRRGGGRVVGGKGEVGEWEGGGEHSRFICDS